MCNCLPLFLVAVIAAPAALAAADQPKSHADKFENYEGTKTCLKCHRKEAEQFFHSQHYRWKGKTPGLVNAESGEYGKINTINDFCTSPAPNWIGIVTNEQGSVVAKGCSKCHAGRGAKPSEKMTEEQLENIDCLICHASGYNRDLFKNEDGSYEWKSILWQNKEGLNSVAKRISNPQKKMCLRCHAASGGGENFKRGDLAYALTDCEPDFDVHMSSGGAGLECIDCHAGKDHRVKGRGADLHATDMPGEQLSCAQCHDGAVHKQKVLNHHTERLACETCHIPVFAKSDTTDMARDWSKPVFNKDAGKYMAAIDLQDNVTPVYAWYNGSTKAALPGKAVELMADGRTVAMMMPQGSRDDAKAKIYPFKLHKGKLPLLKDRNWILPLAVEEFFADGDVEKAVQSGASAMYGLNDVSYTWVDTIRYMGLYHEIQPAEKALGCLDCHSGSKRIDWKALGYSADPMDEALKDVLK
jgi:hypothetical protein